MGNNPSRNPFRRAQLGLDDQEAVDEYKARSVWGAWWKLSEAVRRRYFSREERTFVTRYGARLDELATQRDTPRTDKERHFVSVCLGSAEPTTARERLWLFVQLVCRFELVASRSARADLAEHDAFALRAENRKLKAHNDHLEAYVFALQRGDTREVRDFDDRAPVGNVEWVTGWFTWRQAPGGPLPMRAIMTESHRGPPTQTLQCHIGH